MTRNRLQGGLVACVGAVALLGVQPAFGGDVDKVIPGLYGGDGITLGNPGFEANFNDSTLQQLGTINDALAEIPGNLPVGASAASFTYEFNALTGELERVMEESLGPLFVERASTLGGNLLEGELRFSLAFQYTYVDFKTFEGDDLDDLTVFARAQDVPGDNDFENDVIQIDLDIEAELQVFAAYGTLGLTPWLDLSVVVPFAHISLEGDANATIIDRGGNGIHFFDPNPPTLVNGRLTDAPRSRRKETAFGLGDMIVRAKWLFLETFADGEEDVFLSDKMNFGLLGQVKLPTGDDDDLLGTGHTDFRLMLIASKTFEGWFEPHFNFGYEWNGDSARKDAYLYGAGFSMKIIDEVTVFADLVGKKKRIGEDVGDHLIDASLGLKVNPAGGLIITPSFLVPLNEEGLRADYIPSLTIEYIF